MTEMKIRLAKSEDLDGLAKIYAEAFNQATDEGWSEEKTKKFINFCLSEQPDLFFLAELNGQTVGGVFGKIKPWNNGDNLTDCELFVAPEFQKQGIAKKLLAALIKKAQADYGVETIGGLAYSNVEFPLGWYEKIGFKKTELIYIEGQAKEILGKL